MIPTLLRKNSEPKSKFTEKMLLYQFALLGFIIEESASWLLACNLFYLTWNAPLKHRRLQSELLSIVYD